MRRTRPACNSTSQRRTPSWTTSNRAAWTALACGRTPQMSKGTWPSCMWRTECTVGIRLGALCLLSTFYAHSLTRSRSYYRVEGARRKCTDSSHQGQAGVRGRWALWIGARRLLWERVKAGVHAAVQAAAHPLSDVGSLESEQSGVGSPRSRDTCGRQCRVAWVGFRVPRRRGVLAETAVFPCPAKRVVDFRLDFGFNVGFSRPRRSGQAKLPAGVPGGRPAATSR